MHNLLAVEDSDIVWSEEVGALALNLAWGLAEFFDWGEHSVGRRVYSLAQLKRDRRCGTLGTGAGWRTEQERESLAVILIRAQVTKSRTWQFQLEDAALPSVGYRLEEPGLRPAREEG
jgi:hypothetical protein